MTEGRIRRVLAHGASLAALHCALLLAAPLASGAQEQSRESMATDPTATQWSFQGAVQWQNFKDDEIAPGQQRPKGSKLFGQFRLVAPIPKQVSGLPFTLLPRLTVRYAQNQENEWGFAQTELFGLAILNDWGTGRWGVGPLVSAPAQSGIGSTKWGYGLAGAVVQRALEDQLFVGLLLRQSWQDPSIDPVTGSRTDSGAGPFSIQPILQWTFPGGWYLSNGEQAVLYDWDSQEWFIDLPIRLGKVIVQEKRSWNVYLEYKTSVLYDDWLGTAVDNSIRFNVSLSIPILQ